MKLKTIFIFTAVFLCIVIYSYFAVRTDTGPEFGVSVDLSRPEAIVWPCEVSIVGDNGEKGLRIAPKVGRGWRGEAGGKADYRFFIPEEGKYHIWAYALWYDECANAIFAKINDLDKAIVGNDPIYNKWHWTRGFDVDLKKGTHKLTLSNHSDHIAIQKILFASSTSQGPDETGLVFSDIFYDGFDGCDQGNFASWRQISGSWHVKNPESQTCLIENALIGESEDKAFIIYQNDNWESYCLDITAKLLPSDSERQSVGICFGVKDPNNFHELAIKPAKNSKEAQVTIVKREPRNSTIISEFKLPFETNKWQQIRISLDTGYIEVKLPESDPVRIETDEKIIGGIGLLLQGRMMAYFDNIHIRKVTQKQEQAR